MKSIKCFPFNLHYMNLHCRVQTLRYSCWLNIGGHTTTLPAIYLLFVVLFVKNMGQVVQLSHEQKECN